MEKIKINMTDEVNKAIIEVITHQYKKDCPEAHKLVQDWGYTIEKIDGAFRVTNDHTLKCVYINYYDGIAMYGHETIYDKNRLYKINFVKYLNTYYNDYLYNSHGYPKYVQNVSDAVEKYKKLKIAKDNLEYHNEEILVENKKLQKLLEEHKMQIEYHTVSIEKYNEKIAKLRKEFGLTK